MKRIVRPQSQGNGSEDMWHLRLYVAGETTRTIAALSNLRQTCDRKLAGKYTLEVFNLLQRPQLATGDQILAIPTLVRKLPPPMEENHRESFENGTRAGPTRPAHRLR